MCKKLMFLISLVLLLGVAPGAYADKLECDWGDTYTVSGDEEWDYAEIKCIMIVPAGQSLTLNNRSGVDGNGDDSECGTSYANLIVDGGTLTTNGRFDMGMDHDAYVTVINDGLWTQQCCGEDWYKGIKMPDNSGGCHVLVVDGGTVNAYAIELDDERDSWVEIGYASTIIVNMWDPDADNEERYDPGNWMLVGALRPIPPLVADQISIVYDGHVCTVTTPPACDANLASKPNPEDGATGVKCVNTDVVLEWTASCAVGACPMCRHFVYFGDDCQAVADAPIWEPPPWPEEPDEFMGWTDADVIEYTIGNLPLWTNYCWRIDEGPMGPIVKGDVWTFTTGCPFLNGDLNMDCLLNLEDYNILLESWQEEQYFPY